MGGAMVSRIIIVGAGLLYPAYCSYKTVKSQNIKQYLAILLGQEMLNHNLMMLCSVCCYLLLVMVKFYGLLITSISKQTKTVQQVRWIMYWVVFALFASTETFTDVFLSWLPFYYEAKIAFVCWLVLPYSKGSTVLYKKFIHPNLSKREQEIDLFLENAKERSYQTVVEVGSKGINLAANVVVTAAVKGQAAVSDRLKSYSVMDLSTIPEEADIHRQPAPFTRPNPTVVRSRRLQSNPPTEEMDGMHPPLSNQFKAYSMMNLTQTTADLPIQQQADEIDWDEEYFNSEPPAYTADDMQITRRNNYAQEAVPNPSDSPTQFYYTMPRPRKGTKSKSKQMPPLPSSEENLRRSKRKTKSKRDSTVD